MDTTVEVLDIEWCNRYTGSHELWASMDITFEVFDFESCNRYTESHEHRAGMEQPLRFLTSSRAIDTLKSHELWAHGYNRWGLDFES